MAKASLARPRCAQRLLPRNRIHGREFVGPLTQAWVNGLFTAVNWLSLRRLRVERRANGEASSVMRMELRTVGGRLGGGEVVCDCRWRTCMDVQGWNRAAAFVERLRICTRSEPVADRTTDAVDPVAGPPSCGAVPRPRPARGHPDQDVGAELALWLPATLVRIGSGSGGCAGGGPVAIDRRGGTRQRGTRSGTPLAGRP